MRAATWAKACPNRSNAEAETACPDAANVCQCVLVCRNSSDDRRSSWALPNGRLVGKTVQTVKVGSFRSRRDNRASQLGDDDDDAPWLLPQADIVSDVL